ncbi:MAG: hypothetical protein CMJ49_13345 [Planctomycetaceae bacterium]|nr:hypothetical protein [Planctomycetaceae bacterium]
MKVFLDGHFVDDTDAGVSVHDAAMQHAVGLFETMQAFDGRVFRLEAHLQRLIDSARLLGLTQRLRLDPLCEAVELTLHENDLTEARVRLTVTGGNLSLLAVARGKSQPNTHEPTVIITAHEPTLYPPGFFDNGVSVIIADPKSNPFEPTAGHKTLIYWSRLQSLTAAAASQAGEALWFSVTNHLCGGAVSNAILVRDQQLISPIARGEEADGAIASPVLPGITRAAVLELAEQANIPIHRRMLSISDVLEADELMLTNSSWQILPVVRVESETIGDGTPGPITLQLRDALLKSIESECRATDEITDADDDA